MKSILSDVKFMTLKIFHVFIEIFLNHLDLTHSLRPMYIYVCVCVLCVGVYVFVCVCAMQVTVKSLISVLAVFIKHEQQKDQNPLMDRNRQICGIIFHLK